jgi:ATP-dependent DNA helicase RecG
VLVTHGRLSDEARARIEVLTHSDDGFVIAEKDLELRGPGDFFGTRQSGLPRLRVGDLVRDRELMAVARTEAFRYVEEGRTGGPLEEFLERGGWQRRFGLARVG